MISLYIVYVLYECVDQGLGLKVPVPSPAVEVQGENGVSPSGSDGLPDEEDREDTPIKVVKAVYQFSGTSEDEVRVLT